MLLVSGWSDRIAWVLPGVAAFCCPAGTALGHLVSWCVTCCYAVCISLGRSEVVLTIHGSSAELQPWVSICASLWFRISRKAMVMLTSASLVFFAQCSLLLATKP